MDIPDSFIPDTLKKQIMFIFDKTRVALEKRPKKVGRRPKKDKSFKKGKNILKDLLLFV